MCFSAQASFAAAGVLLPAGIYCASVAVRKRPAYLPLGVIPLFFAFQQASEGLVWVGMMRDDHALVTAASLVFLSFALWVWPFWGAFCVLFLARRLKERWLLGIMALAGFALGGALYVPMALDTSEWLAPEVVGHSLRYNPSGLPLFERVPHEWCDIAYGVLAICPMILALPDQRFRVFTVSLAGSAALCLLVFHPAFVSVWCFFAALLSAELCYAFAMMPGPELSTR
jgi:hypothetical protein